MLAIDMFMASYVPYPAFPEWTTWDNFLYFFETFKDNVVGGIMGAFTGTTGEQRETAEIIAEYIEFYVKSSQKGLSNEANVWSEIFTGIVSEIRDMSQYLDYNNLPSDVADAIQTVVKLKDGIKDAKSFKDGLAAVQVIIDNDAVSLKTLALLKEKGMTLKDFTSQFKDIISSDFLNNSIDYVGLGLDVCATGFELLAHLTADYEANYKALVNIKNTLEAGNQLDDILIGAIKILETEYTNKAASSFGLLAEAGISMGVDMIIGWCPMVDVLLSVTEIVISAGTTVAEEADLILFSQLVYAHSLSIRFDSEVWSNGKLTVSLDVACEIVNQYLHMALFYNNLALEVNESQTIDKTKIKKNIEYIKELMKKYEYYTK